MNVLEGIRVLDLSQFLSGPRATQILASLGAEVIKIEPPAGDAMRMLMTVSGCERTLSTIHQNKKSLVLDLRKAGGKQVFLQLAGRADVLVENFKPGVMEKLGLSYQTLSAGNPRLIYAAISGFGHTGPLSDRTAFDIIAQASGGIMQANSMPGRPPGVFFADLDAGAYCAMGVLAALWTRERTGRGQMVDISMQDVMYFQHFWGFSEKATAPVKDRITEIFGREMTDLLTDYDHPMPYWNSYKAVDGHVVVVALTDRQWNHLLEVIDRKDLIEDPRFAHFISRTRNADEGRACIEPWMSAHTCAQIIDALNQKRIPCAKVLDNDEINRDPQLSSRGMFRQATHPRLGKIDVPGFPIRLSETPDGSLDACPDFGADTDAILRGLLGKSEDEIKTLRQDGSVM